MKKKKETDGSEEHSLDATTIIQNLVQESDAEAALKLLGVYYVNGEIQSDSLIPIQQDILLKHTLGPKFFDDTITLIVNNSPGGDLSASFALVDLLNIIRMPVATIGTGECCSAASMLVAAGDKGLRTVTENTIMMIHRYSWGTYDKQHELVARRKIEDATHEQIVSFWLQHSKYKTRKEIETELLPTFDHWLTAKQALEHGIVDNITKTRKR
jgi:ATP-dependent protease ClpP protease subunit